MHRVHTKLNRRMARRGFKDVKSSASVAPGRKVSAEGSDMRGSFGPPNIDPFPHRGGVVFSEIAF